LYYRSLDEADTDREIDPSLLGARHMGFRDAG